MIKKSNELDFSNKTYVVLIAGRPGVGKTTLALSAPKPVLIDLEGGVDRVEACYRGDTSVASTYEEFVADIKSPEMAGYETIVIDTLGALVDLMKPVVIKENPVNGLKDGKTLSLKGFGAIKVKIKEFFDLCRSLHKNLVIISHVSEFQDGDVTKTRLSVEGSTKDAIWDFVDLGGFIQFVGKERHIYFSPTEKWDAKGTHGIVGDYSVPTLKPFSDGGKTSDNAFLSQLFSAMTENIVEEQKAFETGQRDYEEAMKLAPEIEAVEDVDGLNAAVEKMLSVKHGLTSKEELASRVKRKAKELGATYDKAEKRYVVAA